MTDEFDTVRERAAGELAEDHYAAFLAVGIDDNGDAMAPHVAVDGNRIPPGMSRQQVVAALVAQVIRDAMPRVSLAELVFKAFDVEYQPINDGD